MGGASSKFKKYLQNGDEFAAMQLYQTSPDLRKHLDPNLSYGDSHKNNTALHYAAKYGMKHLLRAFLFELAGDANIANGNDETSLHCACQLMQGKSLCAEERRTACEKNTALHYAAASGLFRVVELLVVHGASLYEVNGAGDTACDMAARLGQGDIASFLESKMVFTGAGVEVHTVPDLFEAEEIYNGLRTQDLQEAKDQLLVETSDMLQIPLFTAEALLRDNEWSREALLDRWMQGPLECCKSAGVQPPEHLVSTQRDSSDVPHSSSAPVLTVDSCDDSNSVTKCSGPPSPIGSSTGAIFISCGDSSPSGSRATVGAFPDTGPWESDEMVECGICTMEIASKSGDFITAPCAHEFCRECWCQYLTTKITEGDACGIMCPSHDCPYLVPLELIEAVVSPEISRKYLQLDIQCKHEFCWVCLESWKKHNASTGGYFRCYRGKAVAKAEEEQTMRMSEASARTHESREWSRFIRYYGAFRNHENLLQEEIHLASLAEAKTKELLSTAPPGFYKSGNSSDTGVDAKRFLVNGIKELGKARRVLCASHVYGFYLEDRGYHKTIFEYMQSELEDVTRVLAKALNRQYLQTPWGDITKQTSLVRRKRHEFLRAVAKGLIPPETPPSAKRKRRRRFPGLLCLDHPEDEHSIDVTSRTLQNIDPSDPWVKDPKGRHTNLIATYEWPDYESDEGEMIPDQVVGECQRETCRRPRAKNPRVGSAKPFCSRKCAALVSEAAAKRGNQGHSLQLRAGDSDDMNLLIAMEMSRLQMLEDEVRRRNIHIEASPGFPTSNTTPDVWVTRTDTQGNTSSDHRTTRDACVGGEESLEKSTADLAVEYFLKSITMDEVDLHAVTAKNLSDGSVIKKVDKKPLNLLMAPTIDDLALKRSRSAGDIIESASRQSQMKSASKSQSRSSRSPGSAPMRQPSNQKAMLSDRKGLKVHRRSSEHIFQVRSQQELLTMDGCSTSPRPSHSKPRPKKSPQLRIRVSEALDKDSSAEFESETGIPRSPTLFISGVAINRSPDAVTPSPPPSRNHSQCCSLKTSPVPSPRRQRSSSLVNDSLAPPSSPYQLHSCPSSPFSAGLAAVEGLTSEKFLFPQVKSKSDSNCINQQVSESKLSSVLLVEESTLSSDDFHEALFLKTKKISASRRRRSKGNRVRDKDRNMPGIRLPPGKPPISNPRCKSPQQPKDKFTLK
ncbi:unnamed protein product [Cyprideis torosa]|uniref:RBR-type E3 ubiquitin transferase n=1 Tax=Cyprideis torosa TaxID=163714 RepID=A0A7R8ZJ97_9CRUS|nr:unnamed protein product [Cyprideis torosa]CAG0886401.1 unnamed protein product [Cyprideis torosa]